MKLSSLRKGAIPALPADVDPDRDPTLQRLDVYLEKLYNKPLTYTPKPSHVPSSFGTKCFRKIYYTYYKVDKDLGIDPKGARIFETGNYFETMIMSWLKGMGEHIPYRGKDGQIPVDKETGKPNPQFPITVPEWRIRKGYIDNVAFCDNGLWLYEIKSSNEGKFEKQTGPLEDHLIQTAPYFLAFGKALGAGEYDHIPELAGKREVAGIKFIYVNKNNSEPKIYRLTADEMFAMVATTSAKVDKANRYIDTKELPPKTRDKCLWCPFQSKCKKEWNEV